VERILTILMTREIRVAVRGILAVVRVGEIPAVGRYFRCRKDT
jgi:hypothetical protein